MRQDAFAYFNHQINLKSSDRIILFDNTNSLILSTLAYRLNGEASVDVYLNKYKGQFQKFKE